MSTNSQQDPNSTFPYAESVSTFGTDVALQGGNGFGLVTRGLLWQAYDIWFNNDAHDGVLTSWADGNAAITTTWADGNAAVTTAWTDCTGGIYGQVPL